MGATGYQEEWRRVARVSRAVFGMRFSTAGTQSLADYLANASPHGQWAQLLFTANLDHIVKMRGNAAFRAAYERAAFVTADGMPVYLYARLRGVPLEERVTGADLFPALMARLDAARHRPFFVVSDTETAARIEARLAERGFPDVPVAVPPFGFETDEAYSSALAGRIASCGTTHLFFCVGAPKSELWLDRHREAIGPCFAMALGAAANFWAGTARRAPQFMQSIGAEWIWRFLCEPRRLFRRYFVDSWAFLLAIADDLLLRDARGESSGHYGSLPTVADFSVSAEEKGMGRLAILFLTTVLPSERRTGGEIVSAHIADALRDLGHEVRVLGYARPGYAGHEGEVLVEHRPIETCDAPLDAARWLARAFIGRNAYSIQKYAGRAYTAALKDALAEQAWNRIILDHSQMGWLLPHLRGHHLIHVSHNCEGRLYAGQAKEGGVLRRIIYAREARLMGEMDARLARAAKSVWTLTEAHAAAFREMGARSVSILPVPPMPLPEDFRLLPPECDVALLGTWSWGPNRAGLDWFLERVVPLVPGLHIQIGGAGADDLRGRFANVEVLGRVPDAAAFLAAARVIAVPSIAGEGLQIKTLDAIAVGRPVVATGFALRGIDGLPERVRVADSPQAFADALLEARNAGEAAIDNWRRERRERFRIALDEALRLHERQ